MEIIFILLLAFSESFTHEWIDPYDMNIYSEINVKSVQKSKTHKDDCYCSSNDDISVPYLKRFVNLLIHSAISEDENSNIKIGKFVLNSETEDFKFLIEFNNKQYINNDELRKLDIIMSSLFEKNISDHVFDTFLSTQKFINILLSRNCITVIGICLSLYITFYLLKSQFSFWYITKYFFFIIMIIDYGFRYETLLEEAEDHNMKLEYSSRCDTSKMTWTEWYKFLRSQQNCEKIFVTPVEVAMLQVKHIIIIPLSAVGTGMGTFGKELWQHLPFPWNILIFPMMLVFILLIYAITMMCINNSPIKIKLFHLINFEFGHQVDNRNHVSGDTLNKLLDAVNHRPMVEDERFSPEVSKRRAIADKSKKSVDKELKRNSKSVRKEKKEVSQYCNEEKTSPNDVNSKQQSNSEERTDISIKPAVNSKESDSISSKDTTSPKECTVEQHNSPENK